MSEQKLIRARVLEEIMVALHAAKPWCNTDRSLTHADFHKCLDAALA